MLKATEKPKLAKKINARELRFAKIEAIDEKDRDEDDKYFISKIQLIKSIPYVEISSVAKYIDDKTLYSTKHDVKGAEFENVIIVLGRGWNQFLEWMHSGNVPADKQDSFERNRNLFYVACSRPRKRLCLLFTQLLSDNAIASLNNLFGNVIHQAK